ncbi:hypothetical protein AAMO2058_001321100 [Amorphochlora amoebiformis]
MTAGRCAGTRAMSILLIFASMVAQGSAEEESGTCHSGEDYSGPTNKILFENCLKGSPSTEWDVNGGGDPSIQGFSTDISYDIGQEAVFKIKTDSPQYRIDIYRLGYYQGHGARKVDTITPIVSLPQSQPECLFQPDSYLVDCGNWEISAVWKIPSNTTSGIFFARPVREDAEPDEYSETGKNWRTDNSQHRVDKLHARPGSNPYGHPEPNPPQHAYGATGHGRLRNPISEPRASHIWFVIRDDNRRSDLLFQTSDPTWQAYNGYGGLTTYGSFKFPFTHGPKVEKMDIEKPMPRSYKASYNRPLITRGYRAVNMPLHAEYPAVRFLEAAGYDVTYASGIDTSRAGKMLLNHKVFLSVGHDEYVSLEQRRNVEKARDAGVSLMFWSANEFYWSIRWENSIFDNTSYRTMVCYKESQSNVKIDPLPGSWTGTFRDARSINPRGAMPENALMGTIFTVNAQRVDAMKVPSAFSNLRFWRNTSIQALKPGSSYTTFRGVLGHEWDEDIDNGYRPNGLIHLSYTWIDNVQLIQDHGSVFDSGSARHTLTLYRATSGAYVFGSGTVQWAWALDGHHDINDPPRANMYATRVEMDTSGPDPNIQQSMINLLADMHAQPTSLSTLPHLKLASPSQDHTPPSAKILKISFSPGKVPGKFSAEASRSRGSERSGGPVIMVWVSGEDEGGGVVGGIEVSLSGGSASERRWHPALRGREGEGDVDDQMWLYVFGLNSYEWLYAEPWDSNGCSLDILVRAVDDSGNIGQGVGPGEETEVEGLDMCRQ